jgi:hypothetical protein
MERKKQKENDLERKKQKENEGENPPCAAEVERGGKRTREGAR